MRGIHSGARALAFGFVFLFCSPVLSDDQAYADPQVSELYGPSLLPTPTSRAPSSSSQEPLNGGLDLNKPTLSVVSSTSVAPPASLIPAISPVPAIFASLPPPPEPREYGVFKIEPKLMPRVKFWVDVYAKYNSWEYAVHHVHHPQLVYSSFSNKGKPRGALNDEKLRLSKFLRELSAKWKKIESGKLKRDKLKAEEDEIISLFEKYGLLHELPKASDIKLIRGQAGLRDGLKDAYFMSGRYLPRMEAVFEKFGLPLEIAHLPFVESGFNKKAVSKVGASGIWQFMPYTGKLYLRVDNEVDERNDPMRAAEAAARLMEQNYRILEEWPLAMTAYNHGAAGVARGVREVGSRNLSDLIEKYGSKSFGFASENFYSSFMAALHVTKNMDAFFGDLPQAKKLEFDEFVMPHYIDLKAFLEKFEISIEVFKELNPALTSEVYSGRKYVPVGYTIRLPIEVREDFFKRYNEIPAHHKFGQQKDTPTNLSKAALSEASPEAAGLVVEEK